MKKPAQEHSSSIALDYIGAIASGLCIGYLIAKTRHSDGIYVADSLKSVLLAIGSYAVAALLIHALKQPIIPRVPRWILIAITGTIIAHLSIILIPNEIDEWMFREQAGLLGYLFTRLQSIAFYFLVFIVIISPIALIIMGLIRYLGATSAILRNSRSRS
jgi:F0F1-type ATP synthase assembly protein I